MAEWWRDPLIVVNTLEKKLAGLPVNRETHRELDDQICVALRLLRAIASRSYGRISMLAVIDVLVAVDYFLVVQDEHPDTGIHGYDDDAERLATVFRNHREELDKFRLWFNKSLSP